MLLKLATLPRRVLASQVHVAKHPVRAVLGSFYLYIISCFLINLICISYTTVSLFLLAERNKR
jgi:hypothetical protein